MFALWRSLQDLSGVQILYRLSERVKLQQWPWWTYNFSSPYYCLIRLAGCENKGSVDWPKTKMSWSLLFAVYHKCNSLKLAIVTNKDPTLNLGESYFTVLIYPLSLFSPPPPPPPFNQGPLSLWESVGKGRGIHSLSVHLFLNSFKLEDDWQNFEAWAFTSKTLKPILSTQRWRSVIRGC